MIKVGILGVSGYTALELIKILLRNPEVQIVAATTRQEGSPPLHEVHPSLAGRLDLTCENLEATQVGELCDYVFCALPHVASMTAVPDLLAAGAKVIDLSADYRLNDPAVYEQWYGHVHTDPTRLGTTVYGLPEIYRARIPGSDLVANPGCYTSTSILALAPLIQQHLIEPTGITIDAKSGVSGAGRALKLGTLFAECNESLTAYGVGTHRHQPEIEQILTDVGGRAVEVTFTPHLIPMDRGILCTIYPKLTREIATSELLDLYRSFYDAAPFVRIVEHLPATKHVAFTNYCDLSVRFNRGQLIVFATLDNLIKGAAGVAVQNFNLLAGFDETTSLLV